MTRAPILVLIVNYRTADLTVQAIESILPEVRSRGDTHIVIVDNGSADGSATILAEAIDRLDIAAFCSLLALEENAGFSAGNNAGLEYYRRHMSRGGAIAWPAYTWLLNPDTIAKPHALGAMVEFMGSHPDIGLCGGRCLQPNGKIRHTAFRFHGPMSEFITSLDLGPLRHLLRRYDVVMPISDHPYRAEWVSGSHMMISGAVFDRIGLLDAGYFLYFEETDFCARAAEAGFEAWHVPASRIVHLGGQSTGLTDRRPALPRPRYWFASRARFLIRHHGRFKTHLANLLWLCASPVGSVIANVRGRPNQNPPRLWRDFLRYNYGTDGLMHLADEPSPRKASSLDRR